MLVLLPDATGETIRSGRLGKASTCAGAGAGRMNDAPSNAWREAAFMVGVLHDRVTGFHRAGARARHRPSGTAAGYFKCRITAPSATVGALRRSRRHSWQSSLAPFV